MSKANQDDFPDLFPGCPTLEVWDEFSRYDYKNYHRRRKQNYSRAFSLRFSESGEAVRTFKEIGQIMGVSSRRAWQLYDTVTKDLTRKLRGSRKLK